MKKKKEVWKCWCHGEFETKADFPRCPKCKTARVRFVRIGETIW